MARRTIVWKPEDSRGLLIVLVLLALFGVVLYRNAWVGDDAFITFRTIDNFLHGFGLRWNIDERVQAYTHPLWLFVLTGGARLTGELFHTTLVISMAFAMASVAVVAFGLARTPRMAVVGLMIFLFSRSFVDYATSGLENPLTHQLLGLFLLLYFHLAPGIRKDFWLSFIAGLGLLNRLDTALLFLPVLAFHLWDTRAVRPRDSKQQTAPPRLERHGFRRVVAVVVGFVPLVGWELFSMWYYGFPFPNTYYAKVDTGIPTWDMIRQGIYYLQNSVAEDPITLAAITAGILWPVLWKQRDRLAISVGIILYLLYVVKVGGDFMSGRFLSAPLYAAVALMVYPSRPVRWRLPVILGATALLLGMLSPAPPLLSGKDHRASDWDAHGIADERGIYFTFNGLLNTHFAPDRPWHPWLIQGKRLAARGVRFVAKGSMGMYCFGAGPRVHCLDRDGLAEPLLARIPALVTFNWRIGHFRRRIPKGYEETLKTGVNHIEDPNLRQYYDALSLVIRGPLLSRERLGAIWALNTGKLDPLMDAYLATLPEVTRPYLDDPE